MQALALVRDALLPAGLDLVASCAIDAYDARAPKHLRAAALLPGARGVIVVGSAGRALWKAFREAMDAAPSQWDDPHPLDSFVARALDRADAALASAHVTARRFEPTLHATPSLNFRALGELVGLGSLGPFGLLIHETHGPWWALRGAWLVDVDVDPPRPHTPPCADCPAPCVHGHPKDAGIVLATAAVRTRCIVGPASRYDEEQLAYHYDHDDTLARLREAAKPRASRASEQR